MREAGTVRRRGVPQLGSAVVDVVRRQREVGIDVPGDGEYGKAMGHRVNYGAWWSYSFQRLGGLELGPGALRRAAEPLEPGEVVLTSFADRRDRRASRGLRAIPSRASRRARAAPRMRRRLRRPAHLHRPGRRSRPTSPTSRRRLAAAGVDEGFMTSIAPGSASRIGNSTTGPTRSSSSPAPTPCARSTRRSSTPGSSCSSTTPPSPRTGTDQPGAHRRGLPAIHDDARRGAQPRIRGLPEDRIRFHLCWGSWHGPHTTDIPMRDIVDVMLASQLPGLLVRGRQCPPRARVEGVAGRQAARRQDPPARRRQPRHERRRAPGARRRAHRALRRRSSGGSNVIAATDCGLGGRVHPQIAWAKLEDAGPGRGAGDAAALDLGTALPSRGPCTQPTPNRRIVDHGQEQEGVRARHCGEQRAGRGGGCGAGQEPRHGNEGSRGRKQTAGKQFDKTRAKAIQGHVQARGQRQQAKRDSR